MQNAWPLCMVHFAFYMSQLGGGGGKTLDRLVLVLVDIGVLRQANHSEDFLEVLRKPADTQLLIVAVYLGNNADQNRNAGAIDIIILAEIQQDMLRALARHLRVGAIDLLL